MYNKLRETLELLAADAASQIAWLSKESVEAGPGVTLMPDEIALDFENWATASWQLLESGELGDAVHSSILDLNEELTSIGSNSADWTREALVASPKWEKIRGKARDILRAMIPKS